MSENDNIENTDQQEDPQSCCSSANNTGSGNCASKMKYAAFGIVMLLAVGVAAHALIEKHKNPNASACWSNTSKAWPDQAQSSDACCPSQKADASTCAMASDSASKETAASCPIQAADASTCTMTSDSAASTCPSKKDCCGSEACKEKNKACGE